MIKVRLTADATAMASTSKMSAGILSTFSADDGPGDELADDDEGDHGHGGAGAAGKGSRLAARPANMP
jgi:hypothetical protein